MMSPKQQRRMTAKAARRARGASKLVTYTGKYLSPLARILALSAGRPVFTSDHYVIEDGVTRLTPVPMTAAYAVKP